MGVGNFLFSKILFPKKLVLGNPGVIINRFPRKYGGQKIAMRTIFYFEDISANLQLETISRLGKKRASEFFYILGKDLGARYLLHVRANRPSRLFLASIIEYVFLGFASSGLSLAESIDFDLKRKILVLQGSDNILCRKSKDGNIFAGLISSVFSFFIGQNIESKLYCDNCPHKCKVVLSPENRQRYVPKLEPLKYDDKYYQYNFPEKIANLGNFRSFNDLLRFKKILLKEKGKYYLKDKNIVPAPIDFLGLISRYYPEHNYFYILKKGVIQGAESVIGGIIDLNTSLEKKLKSVLSILCALGWGIPHYSINPNEIKLVFLYPPSWENDFTYLSLILNGFLNKIFKKNFKIGGLGIYNNPRKIKINYLLDKS